MTLVAEVDLIGLGDGLGVLRQPTTPGRQDQAAARAVAFSCHFFCSVQILRCRGRVKLLVAYPASSSIGRSIRLPQVELLGLPGYRHGNKILGMRRASHASPASSLRVCPLLPTPQFRCQPDRR